MYISRNRRADKSKSNRAEMGENLFTEVGSTEVKCRKKLRQNFDINKELFMNPSRATIDLTVQCIGRPKQRFNGGGSI